MRKLMVITMLVLFTITLSAQRKWIKEIGVSSTKKTVEFFDSKTGKTKICDAVAIQIDASGNGIVTNKNTGEVRSIYVENTKDGKAIKAIYFTENENKNNPSIKGPSVSTTNLMWEFGLDCYCFCCGTGWSMRMEDAHPDLMGCIPCCNTGFWGPCPGKVHVPWDYGTCDCGYCSIFNINPW